MRRRWPREVRWLPWGDVCDRQQGRISRIPRISRSPHVCLCTLQPLLWLWGPTNKQVCSWGASLRRAGAFAFSGRAVASLSLWPCRQVPSGPSQHYILGGHGEGLKALCTVTQLGCESLFICSTLCTFEDGSERDGRGAIEVESCSFLSSDDLVPFHCAPST